MNMWKHIWVSLSCIYRSLKQSAENNFVFWMMVLDMEYWRALILPTIWSTICEQMILMNHFFFNESVKKIHDTSPNLLMSLNQSRSQPTLSLNHQLSHFSNSDSN